MNNTNEPYPMKTLQKADFPETLRNIPRPPDFLYMRGALPPTHYKYLCVIGSRHPSAYGLEACANLIHSLAGYPISVVSGLAIGIDSASHEAALQAGLHTISFPGSGLDWNTIEPAEKRPLARRIVADGGALMSKYEANFGAQRWTFVERNLLMAGISHATLIIEGRPKSGTLITAKAALDFNREVLVVPGSIFSDLSNTPLALMADGAQPITCVDDILRALELLPELTLKDRAKIFERSEIEQPPEESAPIPQGLFDALSIDEQKIISRVKAPVSRDDLIRELDLPAGYVNSLLVNLELRGLIVERQGCLMVR